ncbi:MAG: AAA family ATPase [Bacteroidetes bacterium]|nr:AAA family ATPase [Bacteroidota bacterium]
MGYSAEELQRLQRHYVGLNHPESYDAFLRRGQELLKHVIQDPYHVRLALTRGYSMMELGSRAVLQHREVWPKVELGVLINEEDIGRMPGWLEPKVEHFQPAGSPAFVKITGDSWDAFPDNVFELNAKAVATEYERIRGTKLVEIRRGSGTDNDALKDAMLRGVSVLELEAPLGLIMMNLTWNSNDWKRPSQDKSNHGYIQQGNTPMESWNFDLDNARNPAGQVLGFVQHTAPPKLSGANNLVVFHSAGKVVGFYGKAKLLKDKPRASDGNEYNIIGDRSLAVGLQNKLDDIKAKGYLGAKERMGQNGFIYLEQPGTVLRMLNEAIALNPAQAVTLKELHDWVAKQATIGDATIPPHSTMRIPLNRIFYGPPGTGKTHHTINSAVEICDPEFYAANSGDREKIKARYEALRMKDWKNEQGAGRIGFCTFHQSFGYEDFVEGIKPMKPTDGDTYLKYEVRPGVLKQMVQRAEFYASGEAAKVKSQVNLSQEEVAKAEFFKMSLGDSQNSEEQMIYDYCIENSVVAIGFLGQHDLTGLTEQQIRALPLASGQSKYDHTAMSIFTHYLKPGNYVVVTFGNFVVRAIGRVTGDYYYDPKSEIGYPHFRKVEWLAINEAIPWVEIYARQFSQQTIYKLKKEDVNRDFFVAEAAPANTSAQRQNFVLIIDEINRGNVAGIFGELITLIEENKRKGRPEALEVTLPYSQEPFSIPDNLYIIGTMNTADRSVEALDAALRRRFSFVPMMPEAANLKALEGSSIDITKMLTRINARLVQLLDEDHQIGHSHLWELHQEKDPLPALKQVFKDKIIPQLEEYFHRDRAKLQLVLGERFVVGEDPADDLFLGANDNDAHEPRTVHTVTPMDTWDERAFRSLYEKV